MALSDWFPGWYGGSKRLPTKGPVAAPTPLEPHPQSVEYRRRENGLIGWLRDAVGGWLGPSESHGTRAESQVLSELVRSGPRGVILPWFAPYLDERTGETQQMRLAYRRMWADPNVKAAVLGKILSVCALDLNIIPADRKKVRAGKLARDANLKNEAIAEFVDWNLNERIQGCVPELAWAIFSGGLVDGYSVNEKVWQYEDRDEYAGKYVLTALKPKDVGNTVVLQTDDFLNIVGVQALRYSGGEVFSPSNFVIYRHLPLYCSPVGMSDLRAAYSRWWFLDTILKLRAMGLEKRALPVMYGEYETTAQKPSLEAALALVRSQTWLAVPKGVMVKAMEIAGGADAMFASAVADLKEDIFLAIQGATLQALAGQEGTMRGSSAVHKTTADLFKWHLARCLEVLLNDRDNGLIRDLVDLNYVVDRYPRAVLGAIDTADLMAEAQLDTALMQMGLKLSKQDAYEKYSRRPPTDPDDELTSPQGGGGAGGPPGAGGAPGAPGGGPPGGDPTKPPEPEGLEPPPMPFAEEGWDESKHARDHGKFAKKGSGSGSSAPPPSKGVSKKERAASTGSGGSDEPAGKGGSSPEPVRVDEPDVIADLSKGENADAGEDWSSVTRQAAAEKLRQMATDPHKLRKEAVQVVKKLKTAGETLMGKASAVGKAIYEKGGPVLRQFTDVFHGLGVGLLAGWAYVEHAAESFKYATQAVAKQVAHERGYPPEQVERVAKACAVADGVLAWTVNIPLMHEYLHSEHHIGGWAGFGLAKLGYFMPVASLAFCAYSTVRNPLAMCRAAAKLVAGRGLATSTHHAEDDGPLIGRGLVEAVAERMNAAGEHADWWHALFSSAFDQTHDARQAIAMADEAFAENPEAPDDVDDAKAEDIAEWLTDYTPPAHTDDHDEGGGGDTGGGDTASPTTSGGPDGTVSQFTRATKPAKVEKHGEETPPEEHPADTSKIRVLPPLQFLPWMIQGYMPGKDEDGIWQIGDNSVDLNEVDEQPDGVDIHSEHVEKFDDAADHQQPAWAPYQGTRGGRGWKNSVTGDIVYQEKQPGGTVGDFRQKQVEAKAKAKEVLAQPIRVQKDKDTSTLNTRMEDILPHLDVESVAALVGAQGGSTVHVYASRSYDPIGNRHSDTVQVIIEHPFIQDCIRSIRIAPNGETVCSNDMFFLKKKNRGGGFGLNQFSAQVKACAEAGIHRIVTCAGRGGGMNGYYTWARLGYDATLNFDFRRRLPEEFKGANTVQDLMATPEGRAFWKKRGYQGTMSFELAPGSRSLQVLEAYFAEKGKGDLGIDTEKAAANQRAMLKGRAKIEAERKEAAEAEAAKTEEQKAEEMRQAVAKVDETLKKSAELYGVDLEDAKAEAERVFQRDYEPGSTGPNGYELRVRRDAANIAPYYVAQREHMVRFDKPEAEPIHEEYARKAVELGYDPEKIRGVARTSPATGARGTPDEAFIRASYENTLRNAKGSAYYKAATAPVTTQENQGQEQPS